MLYLPAFERWLAGSGKGSRWLFRYRAVLLKSLHKPSNLLIMDLKWKTKQPHKREWRSYYDSFSRVNYLIISDQRLTRWLPIIRKHNFRLILNILISFYVFFLNTPPLYVSKWYLPLPLLKHHHNKIQRVFCLCDINQILKIVPETL